MKNNQLLAVVAVLLLGFISNASAAPIVCRDTSRNYMTMDDSLADACLTSGVGNLTGSDSDLFANGTEWSFVEKSEGARNPTALFDLSYTAGVGNSTSITGTWSLGASFWNDYSRAALGFKFGTGNTPDEWFVLELNEGMTGGDWTFFSTLVRGNGRGGLSHLNVYGIERPTTEVAEPGTLALIGLGCVGLGLVRRRKTA